VLQRGLKGDISDRPDIRSAESHEQIDIGSPVSDTFYLHQISPACGIIQAGDTSEIQPAIFQCAGEINAIAGFLAGETNPAKTGRPDQENCRGCDRPQPGVHSLKDSLS